MTGAVAGFASNQKTRAGVDRMRVVTQKAVFIVRMSPSRSTIVRPRIGDDSLSGFTSAVDQIHERSTGCYGGVMSKTITQRELRNESGEIMRRLDQGETFTVTRNGVPVGELSPLRRHRFVTADAAIEMFRNAPHVDADRFRADLDAIADQDPNPRA